MVENISQFLNECQRQHMWTAKIVHASSSSLPSIACSSLEHCCFHNTLCTEFVSRLCVVWSLVGAGLTLPLMTVLSKGLFQPLWASIIDDRFWHGPVLLCGTLSPPRSEPPSLDHLQHWGAYCVLINLWFCDMNCIRNTQYFPQITLFKVIAREENELLKSSRN